MSLIDDWIRMLRASGMSEHTVFAYGSDIRRIRSSLNGVEVEDATPEQLKSAFNILRLEGLNSTSLKRMHSGIQNFLRFLEKHKIPHTTMPGLNLLSVNSSVTIGRQAMRPSSPRPYKARKFQQLADPIYLRERYLTLRMGTEEIASEVGCTKQAVCKALRAQGIKSRSHSQAWWASAEKNHTKTKATPIDEVFFSKWSAAAAYVFGVILTDGNLALSKSPDGSVRFGSGRVTISQKEPELLEKVAKLIGHSGKLTFHPRREYHGRVAGALYVLGFSSDKVVADLVSLGLRPKKSLTLQFPDTPHDMLRHFIRGCWDGDGSVFMERKTKLIASFVSGSLNFVAQLRKVLLNQGVGCSGIHTVRRNQTSSYSFKVHGDNCASLYDFLYHGVPESMYLSRKRKVFSDVLGREPIEPQVSYR